MKILLIILESFWSLMDDRLGVPRKRAVNPPLGPLCPETYAERADVVVAGTSGGSIARLSGGCAG